MVLSRKEKCYFWKNGKPEYDINHIPNSINLEETITEPMGLYVNCKSTALKYNRRRFGINPYLMFADIEEAFDVNTYEELNFAGTYAKGLKQHEYESFRLIKHFTNSA